MSAGIVVVSGLQKVRKTLRIAAVFEIMDFNCSSNNNHTELVSFLQNKTGIFDGKPRDFADYEQNISTYFHFYSSMYCRLSRCHPDTHGFRWIPEKGISLLHSSVSAFCSIAVNLVVIILSVFGKHLTKEFRVFFSNLALANILFSVGRQVGILYMNRNAHFCGGPANLLHCTLLQLSPYALGSATLFAGFLTSFHRYYAIVKQNTELFTAIKMLLFCLLCYVAILWPIYLVMEQSQIVHVMSPCPFQFHSDFVGIQLLVLPVGIAAVLHIYYLARLKLFLSKDLNEIAARLNAPVSQVKSKLRINKYK